MRFFFLLLLFFVTNSEQWAQIAKAEPLPITSPRPPDKEPASLAFKRLLQEYERDPEAEIGPPWAFLEKFKPVLAKLLTISPMDSNLHAPLASVYYCKERPKKPSEPCMYFGVADDTLHVGEFENPILQIPPRFRFQFIDAEGKKAIPTEVILLTEHSYRHGIHLVPDPEGIFRFPVRTKKGQRLTLLVISNAQDQGWAKWVWPVSISGQLKR